ncbi:MAG: hypothetical protein M0P70_08745 [Desulfobulbaceae bacterium]|nr:hypothetical protein [Desulfobulbaceae bacterium]
MASAALTIGKRLMHNLAAERLFFVAIKTDCICQRGYGQNYGKPGNKKDSIIIEHYFLPSPG